MHTDLKLKLKIVDFLPLVNFLLSIITYRTCSTLCRVLAKEGDLAAMLWLVSTVTWHAHAAGIKERVRTSVSKNQMLNVLFAVIFSPEQRLQLYAFL